MKSKVANANVQWVKPQGKVSFGQWCTTGFKIGLNDVPVQLPMFQVSTWFTLLRTPWKQHYCYRGFTERLSKKYDIMYFGEGMEEGAFSEAREPWFLRKRLPRCCKQTSF